LDGRAGDDEELRRRIVRDLAGRRGAALLPVADGGARAHRASGDDRRLLPQHRRDVARRDEAVAVTAPLVAIPGYRLRKGRVKLWDDWDAVGMPEQYVEAIRAAGGRPVVLPTHGGEVADDALAGIDALVLAGG